MAKQLTLALTTEQRCELEIARDRHEKAYIRERATAILKIADGQSGRQVASWGLLKKRDPDSVYAWFHAYETDGLIGLQIATGRGRKPAFFPSARE